MKKNEKLLAAAIRAEYEEKPSGELTELCHLNARVKRPANIFAYAFGSASAVVMGTGMSLVMTDIGAVVGIASAMAPGIAIGVVGLGMTLLTYPLYKSILNSRKKKYGAEILDLSEKIMNEQ